MLIFTIAFAGGNIVRAINSNYEQARVERKERERQELLAMKSCEQQDMTLLKYYEEDGVPRAKCIKQRIETTDIIVREWDLK